MEDFIGFKLKVLGEEVDGYYEHSLGSIELVGTIRVIERVMSAVNGVQYEERGYQGDLDLEEC